MKDSYEIFMKKFGVTMEALIEFGVAESIFIPIEEIEATWKSLKNNILEGNGSVFIRGYGRDAKGTQHYMNMYNEIFGHTNFKKDATNNSEPTKLIRNLTKHSKITQKNNEYTLIRNYQVSHIWGRTKNPFAFTAPWNIVYVPKIIDPFTGHESKGELTIQFQKKFQKYAYEKYEPYIIDFNQIMENINEEINIYFQKKSSDITLNKFFKDVKKEFEVINYFDDHEMELKNIYQENLL